MIGLRGEPFSDSFEWGRWWRTKSELLAMGATEILTDEEAKRRGIPVRQAREYAESQAGGSAARKANRRPKLGNFTEAAECLKD
jgi:hypothetical protein